MLKWVVMHFASPNELTLPPASSRCISNSKQRTADKPSRGQ